MSYKQPTQTQLYGDLLTNEQQYNHDIGVGDFLGATDEEEAQLVTRARAGDRQAGHDLILRLAPYVAKFVTRYRRRLWAYEHDLHRLEYLDLVQVGNLVMLEKLAMALQAECPAAYLLSVAYKRIRTVCAKQEHLIDTPQDHAPLSVESLEMLLSPESETPLIDILPAPEPLCLIPTRDVAPLYQAIAVLPPRQQEVVIRYYGLYEAPAESLTDLARHRYHSTSDCSPTLRRALLRLQKETACTYEMDEHEGIKQFVQEKRVRRTPVVTLLEGQQEKLEQAHRRLLQTGERISARMLQKEAHVAGAAAQSYLYQYKQAYPEPSRYERVEHAYVRLQARGEKITVSRLASEAGVDELIASAYLYGLQLHHENRKAEAV